MRSPGMISIELSRREALSNSTRSRGMAHASAVSAPTTHHSVTTTARGKVTVLGNSVSLERLAQCLGVHTSNHGTLSPFGSLETSVRLRCYFRRAQHLAETKQFDAFLGCQLAAACR